jgi:DNA polymerase-3 subunit delta'
MAGTYAVHPLPWQGDSWSRIVRTLCDDRLGHALLLAGRPGTGRLHFAQALAHRLLCQQPLEAGSCASCKACELARQGAHPDFYQLLPEEPGKAIGIDSVRAMLRFIARTSALGARRVVLVSPLEDLTLSASNAFLKGLEEPGAETYFLLVYSRGRALPATVRSRCQEYALATPVPEQALQWLREEAPPQCDDEALSAALALAPGQPLAALSLLQGDELAAAVALRSALQHLGRDTGLGPALAAAASLAPAALLSQLQQALQAQTRALARAERGRDVRPRLRASLQAAEQLAHLQRVLQSGSNPNADLLRQSALQCFARSCEPVAGDARLGGV